MCRQSFADASERPESQGFRRLVSATVAFAGALQTLEMRDFVPNHRPGLTADGSLDTGMSRANGLFAEGLNADSTSSRRPPPQALRN